MNEKLSKNSTSGVTGVHYYKSRNKWTAQIGVNKKMIHLGYFENFDDAVKTRKEAEEHYYGNFSYENSQKLNR